MSFWRNWLRKLAQSLNNSPTENDRRGARLAPDTANSDASTAEDLAFLQEAVKLTAESNVNPSVVYPFLATRTAQLNINLIAAIRAFATDSTIIDLLNFANLVQQFPLGQRDVNLEISIAIYSIALDFFKRDTNASSWATIQNNLGTAYSDRIRGERAQNIEDAIACYRDSLLVYT
ncbi:tetratricopeptide repeat protein, partial [Lyngbya sp. CCY1209]|uniref:tetratricopeptide repeat protein n=1 Tax=Lyngbya sp. CCY1209 TaxID=2886103 RepID=UPI002D203690